MSVYFQCITPSFFKEPVRSILGFFYMFDRVIGTTAATNHISDRDTVCTVRRQINTINSLILIIRYRKSPNPIRFSFDIHITPKET